MASSASAKQPLLMHFHHPPQSRSTRQDQCPDFPETMRMLLHGQPRLFWSYISWIVAFLFIFFLPLFRLLYVKACYGNPKHQLVFQPLIVIAGSLIAFVSFIFVAQTIHKFGRQEIVELETGENLKTQMKSEHNTMIQEGCKLLAKLFTPLLIAIAIHKYWLYADVHLNPLPFGLDNVADLVIIGSVQAAPWTFHTYIYLYVCVLFWEVCKLQLLRMKHFEDTLLQGCDAEDYFATYKRILNFLDSASYHFRWFLAMSGCITVFCDLASLYEIVSHLRTGTGILMTADLMICILWCQIPEAMHSLVSNS